MEKPAGKGNILILVDFNGFFGRNEMGPWSVSHA
jgi:hypothetical protein